MDPLTINPSSPSVLLAHSSDDGNRWFNIDSRFIIGTIMLFGIVIVTVIRFGHEVFDPLAESLSIQGWAAVIARPSLLWFTMGMVLLAVRTLLWLRYHPVAPVECEQAPRLSVVIPAYNEGAMVRQAVDACVRAEYPRDRLDIIVVDDGSTDDTWTHVSLAAQQHRNLVRAVRLPVNQGKRAALAAGFERAAGDIIVTVDSDSLVEQGALLAIAGPFRDERVGVVAGKVCVLNRFRGLLPRMLHVRFVLSFDFLRSAQSSYGTVYCCPGALSAYRASVVKPLVPAWLRQRFLGQACTIGEDRALTNDVLASGYKSVYQRTAVVHTLAPERYRILCNMFLRWERSYIREEIRLWKIMWTLPFPAMVLTLIETTVTNLRYPVAYSSLVLMIYLSLQDPWTILRLLLSIGLVSLSYTLYFLHSERSREFLYGVLYGYFSFFSLFWIFPYALITLRNRSWLTR
ncbi:MAG: glycosyltransferase [Nitrospirota bacterium]|nr:glycosyltransferase [Nitrospirota bacterium]MDP3596450.1 glycosyltransferase [Nitrospirota bacterium]